jgi:hypothetical protein
MASKPIIECVQKYYKAEIREVFDEIKKENVQKTTLFGLAFLFPDVGPVRLSFLYGEPIVDSTALFIFGQPLMSYSDDSHRNQTRFSFRQSYCSSEFPCHETLL